MNKKSLNSNIINEIKLKMKRFESSGPGFSHSLQPYPMYMPQGLNYFQRSFEMSVNYYSNMYYSSKVCLSTPSPPAKNSTYFPCSSSCTLFCGNLPESLEEKHLMFLFRDFKIVECNKNWSHFGFVKFLTENEAYKAYVALNGRPVMGRSLRLEFQNKEKKNSMPNSMKISQSAEFINGKIQEETELPVKKTNSSNVSNENSLTESLLSSLITSLLISKTTDDKIPSVDKNTKLEYSKSKPTVNESDSCENFDYSSDSGCKSRSSLSSFDCESDENDKTFDIRGGAECLNDLNTLNKSLNKVINSKRLVFWFESGKVYRKKLEPGVYCSMNETSSLYSEPFDILVKIANNQLKEYVLFPAPN